MNMAQRKKVNAYDVAVSKALQQDQVVAQRKLLDKMLYQLPNETKEAIVDIIVERLS